MGKPFKLAILSDFGDLLRGTRDAADALDNVGESLDDVARDSDDAADKLKRSFTDSLDAVKKAGRDTSRAMGDDVKDGARKAGDGLDKLKGEADSTAREAAASFDGSVESIADMFQELSANAFAGFGPAGALAGLAIAAGIGIGIGKLTEMADKATDAKESVLDLADELADVDGNPAALDWAARLRDRLKEITDNKEWWEVWQDSPRTRLEEWSDAARRYGLDMRDMARGVAGDTAALDRVLDALNGRIREQEQASADLAAQTGATGALYVDLAADARGFRDALQDEAGLAAEAATVHRELADAVASVDDAARDSAQATSDYRDAVADSLNDAGTSWTDYVKNGKLNLAEYNKAIEDQAKAVEQFERNLVTSSATLSAEALGYIRAMGPEAAPLLQAFVDAPLDQQRRTAANWDRLGRVATDGYVEGLALDTATRNAINGAQGTANSTPVQIPATLTTAGLARAVADAAQTATNNAPTIWLRTNVRMNRVD